MGWYRDWKPYVPVAKRAANGIQFAANVAKKEGRKLQPIKLPTRTIATTFWGQSWCQNLEAYSDFSNRLPRGQTYVRNGSVVDLVISKGSVKAYVSGSEVYTVTVHIDQLSKSAWKRICADCSTAIDSVLDLLQGNLSQSVMQRLTHRQNGMFPRPQEIKMKCSCPDWAVMCKHVAAVLYGVGARLDNAPDLLFTLRGVDHAELIRQVVSSANLGRALRDKGAGTLADADLSTIFGIELEATEAIALPSPAPRKAAKKSPANTSSPAKAKPNRSDKKVLEIPAVNVRNAATSKTTAKLHSATARRRPSSEPLAAAEVGSTSTTRRAPRRALTRVSKSGASGVAVASRRRRK